MDVSVRTIAFGILLSVLCGSAAFAQAPTVRADQDVHGRKGWVLENGALHIAIVQGGGHIAEVRMISPNPKLAINPMFIPTGNGYMGHMVAFPNFGPASPEERQNGIGGHGEANAVDWQQTRPPLVDAQGLTFFYGADLPKTQFRIERAVSLKTGEPQVHVEEWIENLAPYDRPYNLDEHATFGAPFAAPGRSVLDMSGTKAMSDPRRTADNQWTANREFIWPDAPKGEGGTISLREFHAVPAGQAYTTASLPKKRPRSNTS